MEEKLVERIEKLVKIAFNKFGIEISRKCTIDLWNESREFTELAKPVRGYTVIGDVNLFMLYQFANLAIFLSGNVAELGVYKGGSAKLLANIFKRNVEKVVFLLDTFCGMPEVDLPRDLHQKGDFADASLEGVQRFLSDCQNVVLYKGLFSDTLSNVANETFCFVHIDCDIYQSVRECCEFFYPRMTGGGIMLFDDYGFISCPGAKQAVDEYFLDKVEPPIYLSTGQCVVIKKV